MKLKRFEKENCGGFDIFKKNISKRIWGKEKENDVKW